MGQRHQVYLTFKHQPGKAVVTIGIHHQWMFGKLAVHQAARMMQMFCKADDYKREDMTRDTQVLIDILKSVYSIIPEEGYHHGVHVLEHGETSDPRRGDNNDGITVFDFRNIKTPTYCFMKLPEQGDSSVSQLPDCIPVDAKKYLQAYYSVDDGDDYGGWEQGIMETDKPKKEKAKLINENREECQKVLEYIMGCKVTATKDLREMFPAMAKELGDAERERIEAIAGFTGS